MAMTAHILYPAWDAERPGQRLADDHRRGDPRRDRLRRPADDATISPWRRCPAARPSARAAAIAAGCDLALHCSGVLEENEAIAGALGEMSEAAAARLERAMAGIAGRASAQGYAALAAKRDALLAYS